MGKHFNEYRTLNDIVDFLYGQLDTLAGTSDVDYFDISKVITGVGEIVDMNYNVLKHAVYEDWTAIDMLRAEIEYRSNPDKKEVYELICEALGVNQFATKEELKQLIDQL